MEKAFRMSMNTIFISWTIYQRFAKKLIIFTIAACSNNSTSNGKTRFLTDVLAFTSYSAKYIRALWLAGHVVNVVDSRRKGHASEGTRRSTRIYSLKDSNPFDWESIA